MAMKGPLPWTFYTGAGLLAVVLSAVAWWIFASETTPGDHYAKVARYREIFPSFLHGRYVITYIQLALGVHHRPALACRPHGAVAAVHVDVGL